jgi:hypothetical protein
MRCQDAASLNLVSFSTSYTGKVFSRDPNENWTAANQIMTVLSIEASALLGC